MSREDDFFGDYDESPDNAGAGQEDTSEPMIESPAETGPEPAAEEPTRPAAPRARPRPKKKAKTKTKTKPKAKKKPAPKKKATKKPAAKKKKAARPKPKK